MNKTFFFLLALTILWSCDSNKTNNAESSEQNKSAAQKPAVESRRIIMFFGNSITAGYGLEVEQAFPDIIQDRLDSLGYNYKVVNAGLSGETTAAGLNRIEWVLKTIPDIFVLELGANDGLRGLDLNETKKNLISIIEKVKEANPEVKVLLAGMQVPPNMGKNYASDFQKIFPEVAEETNSELIPFILEDVAGNPDLNQDDGIHPTAEGHQMVAENVWQQLQPMLQREESL